MKKQIVKFTPQEFFETTGENLPNILPKTPHTTSSKVFIDFTCREVDNYLRKNDVRIFKDGLEGLSEFQIETIKEACIYHALYRIEVGKVYYDQQSGMPKELPLSETTKDILNQIIYRGI